MRHFKFSVLQINRVNETYAATTKVCFTSGSTVGGGSTADVATVKFIHKAMKYLVMQNDYYNEEGTEAEQVVHDHRRKKLVLTLRAIFIEKELTKMLKSLKT